MIKRMIPVVVAIVCIIITAYIGLKDGVFEKYSYATDMADTTAYFGLSDDEDVAIVYQNTILDTKAKLIGGTYYFSLDFVDSYLNDHFYYDEAEGLLLFTTDSKRLVHSIGTSTYTFGSESCSEDYLITALQGDTLYVAIEFVKQFANFSYEAYTSPNRIVFANSWEDETRAVVKKNTQVRVLGGVKSEILTQVEKDDTVQVLERMDTWAKVQTTDGYIGYVEIKKLSGDYITSVEAVDEVTLPTYTSNSLGEKVCLVWNMVTNMEANNLVDDLLTSTQGVNVVSPTWFALSDNAGNFASLADADYVARMHAQDIQVWALIDNFTYDVDLAEILNKTSTRDALISQLMSTVISYGIDGINVDFEAVSSDAAAGYIQFLRELSIECRKQGIILSADNSYLVNYDRAQQGEVVDYVIIMGYDEHVSASDGVGSVASIGFVQSGIEKTLEVVDASKVINGIPFYTRLWSVTGTEISSAAYSMKEIDSVLSANGVETNWDSATCQYTATYTVDGTTYSVWLEESESLQTKLSLMSNYNLAGVACWRLGQEKSSVWDVIGAYLE